MTITQHLGVALWDDEKERIKRRFEGQMVWLEKDPAAVRVTLTDPHGVQYWTFSRDVLYVAAVEGVNAGAGDIELMPTEDTTLGSVIICCMTRKHLHQHILLPRRTVEQFIVKTLTKVSLGAEDYSAQVDLALAKILS